MRDSHNFVTDPARGIAALIDDAATSWSNRGHTREHAIRLAAVDLGVPENRARAFVYGKLFKAGADEYRAVKARYAAHLEAKAADLERRTAEARARAAAFRAEMDIRA